MSGDLGELPRLLEELRELIPQGHAAVKDLRPLLAEHRRLVSDGITKMLAKIQDVVNTELAAVEAHMQAQMNAQSADLNQAVNAAREHISRCLTPSNVTILPDGKIQFMFKGNFMEDAKPHPQKKRTARSRL